MLINLGKKKRKELIINGDEAAKYADDGIINASRRKLFNMLSCYAAICIQIKWKKILVARDIVS